VIVGPSEVFAPWTDHPAELDEMRTRMVHILNRLGRIDDELHELHADITALARKVIQEDT
jgi:hypothetical protein